MRLRATRLSAISNAARIAAAPANALFDAAALLSLRIPAGSQYSGPLIRVRRSSDNTEQDIGAVATADANGDRFLDTAALLTFVGSGSGFVRTWYDQSGNDRHATQTNTSRQPRIVNAGVLETQGGVIAINPNGTSLMAWSVTYTAGTTMSFVVTPVPAGAQDYLFDAGGNRCSIISGYLAPIERFSNPRFTVQSAQSRAAMMITSQDGGTSIGYVNGQQTGSGTVTQSLAGGQTTQLFAVTSTGLWSGFAQEIAIFNRVVSVQQRGAIFTSQQLAFAIT